MTESYEHLVYVERTSHTLLFSDQQLNLQGSTDCVSGGTGNVEGKPSSVTLAAVKRGPE
jgi:hypothetical protein